jgi:CzcA family heavy metal efflux pump
MTFGERVHAHRRSILFVLVCLALSGLAGIVSMPVALFPEVHFPRVLLSVETGDRPAERMAAEVTWPLEEAARAVPGVRGIRSTTSRGSAEISISFGWDDDMTAALLNVQSAVSQVLPSLPSGTAFEIRRMDPTVFPAIGYSLTSDTRSPSELRDLAQYQLRPILSTVAGVAKTDVQGGAVEEYQVDVDPARLAAAGLAMDDVARALSTANVLEAVGRLEADYRLYLVVADTGYRRLAEIADTIVRSDANGVVRVDDVATVRTGAAPQTSRVTADGHDAVLIQIYQQPAGNTVQISADVAARLEEIRGRLPADVKIAKWYDQSELVVSAARSVRDAVLIGVLLSVVILLVFLRNAKITLIAAFVVPSVLATTVLLLYVLHMSFNIMTLGGMAAAVGLVIDDAIVMIEHIVRRLRDGTGEHGDRVRRAAREFTAPLVGSSLSTIIIFAPLAFLSGVTGAFFQALALTMGASLVISFLVAWLVVPVLAERLLGERDARRREGGFLARRLGGLYERAMRFLLPRPLALLAILLPLLAIAGVGYVRTGSGFMPKMDEGGFILDYRAPPGTSLSETDRLMRQVEAIVRAMPEVQSYSRRTGLQFGWGITEANEGDLFVRLEPFPRRDIEPIMDELRSRVERGVPGLEIEMLQLMEDVIGDLTAVPQPIEIKLFSDDGRTLGALAPRIARAIEGVPGVVDVNDGLAIAGDALEVVVDRDKAALEGVDPEAVTRMISIALAGEVTTELQRGPKLIGVRVGLPQDRRATEREVAELQLAAPDGHRFPIKRVATIARVAGQPQIKREDLKRMVAVTGRISGRDMGSTIKDVKDVLARPGVIPAGVYYRLGGLYAEQQAAFRGLVVVLVAAVLLVFLLLLFLYERFRVALAILATTLLSIAAVFVGLWLTGTELNITSLMGLTMIVGIVTEIGIFYYSECRELAAGGEAEDLLIVAGRNRARPIAMTTLAAIFALMPLAVGFGHASTMQQPLAIAIIAGLSVQIPLVLVVLPVLLSALRAAPRAGR